MEKKYALDFDINGYSWIKESSLAFEYTDSSQLINGKHPLLITSIIRTNRRDLEFYEGLRKVNKSPFSFILQQDIVFRDNDKKHIKLVLNAKSMNIQQVHFKVTCFDDHEKITLVKSININHKNWKEHTLSFTAKNTRMMTVEVFSTNEYDQQERIFWVDRLKILVDKEDFNQLEESDTGKTIPDQCRMYPLSSDDENTYRNIDIFKDKKITAIGESMHGSEDIRYAAFQCLKSLILDNGCRIILMEAYADEYLKWDLYTQGIAPEEMLPEILDALKVGMSSPGPYRDFFIWLRKYNAGREDKVRIFGMDKTLSSFIFIQDFFNTLGKSIDREIPGEVLKKMNHPYYVTKLFQTDTVLRNSLCKRDREYIMFLAEKILFNSQMSLREIMEYNINTREMEMWKTCGKIISLYAEETDRVAVFAHSEHVNKMRSDRCNDRVLQRSLGSYFAEKYKDGYYCVSIQAGTGYHTQDREHKDASYVTDTLTYPETGSFEKFGLDTGLDYFYCPAQTIPKDVHTIRMISRASIKLRQFIFMDMKNRFDGYVFISKSRPLQDMSLGNNGWRDSKEYLKKMKEKMYR